jgi:predicted ATPase
MEERMIPARFVPDVLQASRPEGYVHRATDDRGQSVRLVVSHADASSPLLLRRAHTALMRLAHPHVASAIALEPLGDGRWLSASEWLAPVENPSPEQLLAWLPGWLAGLAHLHQAGFVHGDLGPDSLGLAADGTPKLADAGRGWRIGQRGQSAPTDRFAAPESRSQARIDGRADLYMLGAVCHYWLTGTVPTPGDALETDSWPEALAVALDGMLAASPSRRFATALEVRAALGGTLEAGSSRHATPFVGRRAELDRLLEVAGEVSDGGACRVIAIAGEAGVGKTRLMEEFRQRLVLRGFAIATASAAGRADGSPYGAWAPLLSAIAPRVAPAIVAELAPVLVGLVDGLQAPPASALEPRAARMRLSRAIATWIEEAAGTDGLALFLDDWHRADEASRELLSYLKRALPAVPVCIVLAVEGEAPEGEDGLNLGRFGHQEVGQLLRHVRGTPDPDGGLAAELGDLTDGHPALVEEAVLEAVGAMAGAARGNGGPRAQLAMPKTFQALWTQRLSGCSRGARALAAAAAVAGAQAGVSLLKAASGQSEEAFLAALDELIDSGVLTHDAAGYTLAAPAGLAAAEAAPEEARQAHAEALSYWRVAAQMGQAVSPGLLAHHALGAEDVSAGAYYALAAAKEALKLFALDEAGRLLARAATCLDAVADAPASWRADLAAAQGDHQRYLGQGAEAERRYREALTYATSQPPYRTPELLTSLGISLNLQSRSDEAEATYRQVLDHPALMAATRARASTALARLYVRLGKSEDAAGLCRGVLEMADAPDLYRGEALGLLGLMCVTSASPRAVEGLRYLDEAQTLAMAAGDRVALNNVCMLAGNARMALGQLPEARAAFERNYLLCMELGLADEQACATLNLAQVAFEQGRLVEAWDRANAGALAAQVIGNRIYEAYGKIFSGLAGCHLGRLAEAEQAFVDGLAIAQSLGSEHLALQVLLAHLEGAVFLGRLGKAEELGLELARRQKKAGIHEFAGRHALLMGHLYELAGEVEEAIGYFQRARGYGEGTGSATLLAGAALGAAMVALRAGQHSVAGDRAQEAHDLAESAGAELARLQALLVQGRAALALEDLETARHHLLEADRLAGELASPHWQAMVWQFQACLSDEEAPLRRKAGVFYQFYLQQLPLRARQEFLNWPERKEAIDRPIPRPAEQAGHEG